MNNSRWERHELLSGAVFVILMAGSVPLMWGGSPDFVGPPGDAADFAVQHQDDIVLGGILALLAVFALVWFLGCLRAHLAEREGGTGRVAGIAHAGGLLAAGLLLASAASSMVLALRADDQGEVATATAATLLDLSNALLGLAAPVGFALLLAGSAVLSFRAAALPRWLGAVGAVAAVGLLVPYVSYLVVLIVPLWVLAVSILLWLGAGAREPSRRPTPAAAMG